MPSHGNHALLGSWEVGVGVEARVGIGVAVGFGVKVGVGSETDSRVGVGTG